MTAPTYPRLPLSEVPGYMPDGPVMAEYEHEGGPWVWLSTDSDGRLNLCRLSGAALDARCYRCALILDPTGLASLARAVAARVGLDVSGGVRWWDDGPSLTIDAGAEVAVWAPGHRLPAYAVPALRDATDTASALAIVARAVLT